MCERRETKLFDTPNGQVKVSLFEGKVGWEVSRNSSPLLSKANIFAYGLKGIKYNKLNLTESEGIELNQNYFEWLASDGCGNCKLLEKGCSGLKPVPFEHIIDGNKINVNGFEADFNPQTFKDSSFNGLKRKLKKDANCKPKQLQNLPYA